MFSIARFILFIFVFIISIFIAPIYTESDQVFYNQLYLNAKDLDIFELFLLQQSILSSIEPGYVLITWLFGGLLDRITFIAISNSILAVIFFNLWTKKGGNWVVVFILIITNYYFYVLYFSAERLKFAFIFFGLSLLYRNKIKNNFFFVLLSLLTHFQIFLLYIGHFFNSVKTNIFKVKKRFKLSFLLFGLIILFIFNDYIFWKINFYLFRYLDFEGIFKIIILFSFSYIYSSDKKFVFLSFLPILISVFFLTGERIVILGYFHFIQFSIGYKKGFNLGIFLINLYLMIKTFFFINDIVKFGSAF